MKPATQKILGWAGLAIGLGGTLFFLVLSIAFLFQQPFGIVEMGRIPGPGAGRTMQLGTRDAVLWTAIFGVVALASWFALWIARRKYPDERHDALHLRLSDLIVIVFVSGSVTGIEFAMWGAEKLLGCALIGIAYGVFLALGFMLAESRRIPSGWRYLFSFSASLAIHGALAVGGLLAGVTCVLYLGRPVDLFLSLVFSVPEMPQQFAIMAVFCAFLRAGLSVAPAALFLCWVAWCQRPIADSEAVQQPPVTDRRLTALKALGWVGLAIGLGGLIYFLSYFVGPQQRFFTPAWTCLVVTALIVIASGGFLLSVCRRTPNRFPLRFVDMVIGVCLCGLANAGVYLLARYLFMGPSDPWTVPMSEASCLAGTLVVGLILMQLPVLKRYAFPFGLVPLVFGALAAGAFVVVFTSVLLEGGFIPALHDATTLLTSGVYWEEPLSWTLRRGLMVLPVGAILCWLAWSRRPKVQPNQRNAAGQGEPLDPYDSPRVKA